MPLALAGIVPVKVSAENGFIRPGDLLALSSTPGVAARAKPVSFGGQQFYLPGSFFGKALEPFGGTQDRPFGGTQNRPFGGTQNRPFGGTQDRPFGGTQDGSFDSPATGVIRVLLIGQ